MAALSLSPPLQWTWWLPWPATTGEEHLGKLLLMNTQWLVTCSVLRKKPSWNNADGLNVHGVQCHTQFGTSAGMPPHLWVKSTVTSPSDTHPRCWDRGQAHRQHWAWGQPASYWVQDSIVTAWISAGVRRHLCRLTHYCQPHTGLSSSKKKRWEYPKALMWTRFQNNQP